MASNARAVIDLVANTKQFNSRTDRVLGKLKILQGRMEGVSRAARRMLIVGAAAATGMTIAFARFEQQMARVLALTGATEKEFVQLNKTARDLGKSTVFSATQAAEAMAAFALQGFKANEIMSAMKPTLDLAAAGQLGMGQAASITAGIMRAMKLDAEDLVEVVDVIAKAATSSATDVQQLGEAMRALGPVAQSAGVSLQESVAIIQAMADVMIRGGSAGTALRNILIRLQAGAGESGKALRRLGVNIKDVDGTMKPLADIIDDINDKMVGLDQVTRNATVAQIAGLRAAAAFTEIMSLGGDTIRRYTAELENAGGTAKKIADIQIATLSGSFKLLTSAVNETLIAFGTELEPVMTGAAAVFTEMTGAVNNLDETTKELVVTLGTLSLVFVAITAAGAPLLKLLGGTATALAAISGALVTLAAAPIAPLIVLVAALAAEYTALAKVEEQAAEDAFELRQEMDATTSAIQSAIPAFKQLAEAQRELASTKGFEGREEATRKLIATEKLLIDQIREEAKQRGAAASDEQREGITAQAELSIQAIQRQIDAHEKLFARYSKHVETRKAAEKEHAAARAAFDEAAIGRAERTEDADEKVIEIIKETNDELRVLRGEITEIGIEAEKMFEAGVSTIVIERFIKQRSRLFAAQIEQEFTERDEAQATFNEQRRKDEAEAIRRSVMTKDAINAEKRERIDLLEQEGRLTAEIADKAREALKIERERSLVGRLEGIGQTFRRIQAAAAGRSPGAANSPAMQTATAAKQTTKATEQNTKATGKVVEAVNRVLDLLAEIKNDLPLVGAFG